MTALIILLTGVCRAAETTMPYPQAEHLTYHGIKPSNHSQAELNKAVADFYDYWKEKYLVESSAVPGDYKVDYNEHGRTVSEAMGYGMLITVQMAGHDPKAKEYFDGLNRFRKRYPSIINNAFMNWRIMKDEADKPDDSATDGDLDIAAALLMAARQWNDETYQNEAKHIIKQFGIALVREDGSLRLGDWNTDSGHAGTRPSDFATAHLRMFYDATGDELWLRVEAKCYTIMDQLQREYSPQVGLIPDFAVWKEDGNWGPAPPHFLEDVSDGSYGYNACRIPWRIGFSAVYLDDDRARQIVTRMMNWVVKNHTDSKSFMAGYALNGQATVDYEEPAFTAPTGVAAMTTGDQQWLNATFDDMKAYHAGYYSDSINLLSMMVMSGNYWLPTETKP